MTESCYIMHRVTTAEIQQNQSLLSEFDAIKHARFMSHATEINFKDNLIINVSHLRNDCQNTIMDRLNYTPVP